MNSAGRRLVDGVVFWAVVMTNTGVNKHHRSPGDLAFWTLELHLSCFSAVRGATPVVAAQPTKPGFVGLDAGAVFKSEARGFSASLCFLTPAFPLQRK